MKTKTMLSMFVVSALALGSCGRCTKKVNRTTNAVGTTNAVPIAHVLTTAELQGLVNSIPNLSPDLQQPLMTILNDLCLDHPDSCHSLCSVLTALPATTTDRHNLIYILTALPANSTDRHDLITVFYSTLPTPDDTTDYHDLITVFHIFPTTDYHDLITVLYALRDDTPACQNLIAVLYALSNDTPACQNLIAVFHIFPTTDYHDLITVLYALRDDIPACQNLITDLYALSNDTPACQNLIANRLQQLTT